MRIPDWTPALKPQPQDLVDAVLKRRGGTLINLDKALLWSEPLARAWNVYLGAVRTGLPTSRKLRELGICTVALLTDAKYEYHHHAPDFLTAGGKQSELDALNRVVKGDARQAVTDADLGEVERLVVQYAAQLTVNAKVDDTVFAAMQARFTTTEPSPLTTGDGSIMAADPKAEADQIARLHAWRSVYTQVSRFIENDKLRQAFSFHSLLVGGNPFETSSIYALIHALERRGGVWFPRGGTGALIAGLSEELARAGAFRWGRFRQVTTARALDLVRARLADAGYAQHEGRYDLIGVNAIAGEPITPTEPAEVRARVAQMDRCSGPR